MAGQRSAVFTFVRILESCIILEESKECWGALVSVRLPYKAVCLTIQRCLVSCPRVKAEGCSTQNSAVEGNGMRDMFDVPLGSL